jgi:membrane associated rhomboid family serine protease/Flp pilus assembly protein TadD
MANCVKCGRKMPSITFGKNRDLCKWCVEYEAMQRGELVDDDRPQPVMSAPWQRGSSHPMIVTQVFVGICVAVYLAMALATQGGAISSPTTQQLIACGANFGPLTVSGEWWRLFTCMFVHIGFLHIALNMWCLWYLGEMAEGLYGHWTFAAVYLISGLGGSVVSTGWHSATVSAGASGAIFGLAGALIASLKLGKFSLPTGAVKGTLSSVLTFAGYNLVFGMIGGHIDNSAHIGGLVTGLILGALIALAAPDRGDIIKRVTVLTLVLLLVGGGVAWLRYTRAYVAHTQRASQFLDGGHDAEAIAEFQAALKQQPSSTEARLGLARLYYAKGQFADAEAQLKKAVELAPAAETPRYFLGLTYLREGRKQDAKDLFANMIASNPRSAAGHFGLGKALADERNDAAAIGEFQRVLALSPEDGDTYYRLGLSSARLKRYDDAINAYRKAIQIDGNDYDVLTALADAYDAKGMKQQAAEARSTAERMKSSQQ